MKGLTKILAGLVAGGLAWLAAPAVASASGHPVLQYVYGGSAGTVVFIHGKGNCEVGATDASSGAATPCAGNPAAYWTNAANGATLLNEATTKYTSSGTQYYEAFAIGHDTENQGYWSSYADVANCLRDLINGTNGSGCNPSLYKRTYVHIVVHSAGGPIIDRIISSGWYTDITPHITGYVISDQGALAGARSSSALYNVDGQGNWVTGFVSWLGGMIGFNLKSPGAWSLTRGNVINEASWGHQGKSPIWILKVTTAGGCGSANNDSSWPWCSVGVSEHDNDWELGAAASAVGYSDDDDTDGLLWMYDTDPTSNTGNGGGKYNGNYTGYYWHWFSSWANHSHGRNDAYTTLGDWNSTSGCYTRSPGTCFAQYGM